MDTPRRLRPRARPAITERLSSTYKSRNLRYSSRPKPRQLDREPTNESAPRNYADLFFFGGGDVFQALLDAGADPTARDAKELQGPRRGLLRLHVCPHRPASNRAPISHRSANQRALFSVPVALALMLSHIS